MIEINKSELKTKKTIKYLEHTKKVLNGNYAAAEAAALCRANFIPAYPITPQTSIVEKLAQKVAEKEMNAIFINMDSEHSVFCAAMGASLCGSRVFTATSGQGLFYAHEALHAISHFRLPIVACNVGRPSIPWNIWSDQSDSFSQRDTGWVQIYGETAQEVFDSVIQGYKIAETIHMPVLVVLDAFYQSHTSENVWIPDLSLVDKFLPAMKSDNLIEEGKYNSIGGLVPPQNYDNFNYQYWKDILKVESLIQSVGKEFKNIFGRDYSTLETINIKSDTKIILVSISSISSTIKGVIDQFPEVGLIKIRLYRPFPVDSLLEILKNVSQDCILVNIDRNFLGEKEGGIAQELKRSLYGNKYPIYDVYAGLGGKDVPPETIIKIISKFRELVNNEKKEISFRETKDIWWADVE